MRNTPVAEALHRPPQPDPLMDKPRVLLVDDNPDMIRLMAHALNGLAQLRFAKDGDVALQQMQQSLPDLVLLDAEMPGRSGFEVCAEMKADATLAEVPVIFVTSHSGPAFELKGLDAGAVDFIAKPISAPLLVARVKTHLRIKRLTDELKAVASTDGLTGLLNRRSFDAILKREWLRCVRMPSPISVLLVDVDHFKKFNDRYGHPAGDGCLCAVAQALRNAVCRPGDSVSRIGGEEFALVLPQTDRAGAVHVAERLLGTLRELNLPHADSPTRPYVTVSIGITSFDDQSVRWPMSVSAAIDLAQCAQELLRSADQALYAAKTAGRARAHFLDLGQNAAGAREAVACPA